MTRVSLRHGLKDGQSLVPACQPAKCGSAVGQQRRATGRERQRGVKVNQRSLQAPSLEVRVATDKQGSGLVQRVAHVVSRVRGIQT